MVVIILISGVAGYTIGASGIPARTQTSTTIQTTTVTVISTNFAIPTTSIETTNSSTYCIQTGIHGTLYIRVVSDNKNQPVSGANVTATIMNHCGSEYPVSLGLTNSTGYSSAAGWTGNFLVSVEYAGTNYTFPATTSGAVSLATLSIPSGVAVEKTIACGGLGCVDTTTTATASSSSITLQSSSTTTQSTVLPAVCLGDPNFGFFGSGTIQTRTNSSATLCVEYYYYGSQSKTFSPISLISVQGFPKNGSSFNAVSNFTITASVNELTIGGPSNENEGSLVTYTITSKSDSNGTYLLNLGWLAVGQPPNVSECGMEFLLVSGNGNPSYTNLISMCITMTSTGTLPYPYPAGTIFAKVVGATNGTA